MSDVESTTTASRRTVRVPQQRAGRTRTAPPGPTQFDRFGNPLGVAPPPIVLRNTTHTSGRAIASLVLGLLSLAVGGPILGVPAMLLSIGADREIARSHGQVGGSGSARIGFWTGVVGSLLGIYAFFALVTLVGFSVSIPLPVATR